jgi:hypothetical protein
LCRCSWTRTGVDFAGATFLEAEHKQYDNAVEHEASLSASYRALVKLFEMRSGAIAEGMARAWSADASPPPDEPPAS